MHRLRFGFKTAPQHTTYADLLTVWQEADGIETLEHGWLFDHLNPITKAKPEDGDGIGPCLEGWTALTALATQTKRLQLGMMTGCNSYRDPAMHAQLAAMVDIISGGRFQFGMGAGWNIFEHESRNIPLLNPGPRIRKLDEALQIAKLLWTQETVDFDGKFYTLKGARLDPKPVQQPGPPIVIGGSGEQLTLKVVAKHAGIWNFSGGTTETLQHKLSVLKGHCEDVGRDFGEIEVSTQYRVNFDDLDTTVREVQALVDAGVTHMILNLNPPHVAGMATRLAEEVIPNIQPAGS